MANGDWGLSFRLWELKIGVFKFILISHRFVVVVDIKSKQSVLRDCNTLYKRVLKSEIILRLELLMSVLRGFDLLVTCSRQLLAWTTGQSLLRKRQRSDRQHHVQS